MSRSMTKQLLLVYLAMISGTAMLTVLGNKIFHLHHLISFFLLQGLIYLAAACKTLNILYQTIRSTRWFEQIEDDSVLIVILVILGVVFVLIGLLGLLIGT